MQAKMIPGTPQSRAETIVPMMPPVLLSMIPPRQCDDGIVWRNNNRHKGQYRTQVVDNKDGIAQQAIGGGANA
jgi:hypothetical protein